MAIEPPARTQKTLDERYTDLGVRQKQGNAMMCYLLVEAAQTASRLDPDLRRDYQRLKFRRSSGMAKVAIARKLAVRLYWKLREATQPVLPARMQGVRQVLW